VFTESDEQRQFRSALRRFLQDRYPEQRLREDTAIPAGYSRELWVEFNDALGIAMMAVPPEFGGAGGSASDIAVAFEECGRTLFTGPLLSTVGLGVNLILRSGDDAAASNYLPAVARGELTLTVAAADATTDAFSDRHRPGSPTATAVPRDDAWLITGQKRFVIDGGSADVVFVPARTDSGLSIFAVERDAANLQWTELETLDLTRRLAHLQLDATPGTLVGQPGDGEAILAQTIDAALVGLAAEQVGGTARLLELSVDYATKRTQFGRPIGSFQAVQHLCADMFIALDEARCAARAAATMTTDDRDAYAEAVAIAKIRCSDAYFDVACAAIEVHGGIGFTWDHPAHLYYRRAKSDQMLLGNPNEFRQRLAKLALG
jgi:alkylation response protein AidB-like acyl-CoA dehydrogenase